MYMCELTAEKTIQDAQNAMEVHETHLTLVANSNFDSQASPTAKTGREGQPRHAGDTEQATGSGWGSLGTEPRGVSVAAPGGGAARHRAARGAAPRSGALRAAHGARSTLGLGAPAAQHPQ